MNLFQKRWDISRTKTISYPYEKYIKKEVKHMAHLESYDMLVLKHNSKSTNKM